MTINTPVRDDYQLTKEAARRVDHVNVYDPKDPVQANGGKTDIPIINESIEVGSAGREFNNAYNIEVDNPQGIEMVRDPASFLMYPTLADFHNSHNRVNDWINKTKIKR